MAEQTTKPTQEKEKKLDVIVLYHIASRHFEIENCYAMGGVRPNAKFIAQQYGAKLEMRRSKLRDHRTFIQRDRYGIADNGDCLSAVLIGENREQLEEARDEIYHTLGVGSCGKGSISE